MRVAGLAPVNEIPGLENIDVTKLVNGHMAYRAAMPRLLREVGWQVESDVFTEIEDPDPENHEKRQRELIREIDEARKDAQEKPEKKRFGFFKRGKLAEKKGWETYDDKMRGDHSGRASSDTGSNNVLFDIEAIKAELASEQIEVKQLESTLPPMKLSLHGGSAPAEDIEHNQRLSLRETKSYDASMAFRPKLVPGASQTSLPNKRSSTSLRQSHDEHEMYTGSKSPRSDVEPVGLTIKSAQPPSSPLKSSHSSGLPSPIHTAVTTAAPSAQESSTPPHLAGTTIGASVTNLEHNAWLDDDEDFGKEQEVTMSFA